MGDIDGTSFTGRNDWNRGESSGINVVSNPTLKSTTTIKSRGLAVFIDGTKVGTCTLESDDSPIYHCEANLPILGRDNFLHSWTIEANNDEQLYIQFVDKIEKLYRAHEGLNNAMREYAEIDVTATQAKSQMPF